MAACSAYNCSNKIGQNLENVTFHRFPLAKPDQLLKWLRAMQKEKWHPDKNDIICSEHFSDDQFVEISGYRFLVYNAVPSKFETIAPPKKLFPMDWPPRLLTVRDIECENWSGYSIEAKIPIQNKDEFLEWLKEHEQLGQISYVLSRDYPLTTKLSFKAEYVCQQKSSNPENEKPCPARMLVRIRNDPKFRFTKPSSQEDSYTITSYPCTVILYHMHNHSIGSNIVETKTLVLEEVSPAVRQKFVEMFKGGYSIELALSTHQKDLFEEYADEYDEVFHDAYVCPSQTWLENFYSQFVEEFGEWNNERLLNVLTDEIEDINATKSKAVLSTIGEHTIIALCTPLMQRSHCLKVAGETVFVDNSGFIDKCNCFIYIFMTYSCTEGLPLGLIITTSNDEEVLTAAFKLLTDILPDKAFGQFGSQGPEVFLTANDDALQKSLKTIYPDATVLLCSFNMCHALWSWLWNPENEIEDGDRCILFSLTYKFMKTTRPEEFNEQDAAILANETVQKYEKFKTYFEEIKGLSDKWAICFKNEILDKNKEISSIELASHILKDKIFLTKSYNMLQLLKYFTDIMEIYYRQKVTHSINNTLGIFILSSFKSEMRESSDLSVQAMSYGQYEVKNMKSGRSYFVDPNIFVCSCVLGMNGARCKHLYAVCAAKTIDFSSTVPDDEVIKRELFWIGTETVKKGPFDPRTFTIPENDQEIGSSDFEPRSTDGGAMKGRKQEAKRILERLTKSILDKYDKYPSEFHQSIVALAVNYQHLNNEREIMAAMRNFGRTELYRR